MLPTIREKVQNSKNYFDFSEKVLKLVKKSMMSFTKQLMMMLTMLRTYQLEMIHTNLKKLTPKLLKKGMPIERNLMRVSITCYQIMQSGNNPNANGMEQMLSTE